MSLILGRKYGHNCNVLQYIAVSVLYFFNKYWANSSHFMKEDKDFEIEAASIALSEEQSDI